MNGGPGFPSWPQLPVGAPGAAAAPPSGDAASAREREKVAELAREFEAFFILQMVRQMRQSMLDDEHGQGLGAETMTDTMDVEFGRQLAATGGIGLARVLQEAIERQAGAGRAASAAPAAGGEGRTAAALPSMAATRGAAVPAARRAVAGAVSESLANVDAASWRAVRRGGASETAPAVVPSAALHASAEAPAVPLPVASSVSSAFGWRSDPFHGATRFHAGVDIRAAYGREVPAAGSGQVVFSGAQGGYGNTVVIEHPGGVRTRYAHLSSIQVEVGARVQAGTVIGRVGSTGRSTGPHLHFEVLQDGHPVDPEIAATRFAEQLKVGGVDADLPLVQPSARGVAVGVDDEDSGQ